MYTSASRVVQTQTPTQMRQRCARNPPRLHFAITMERAFYERTHQRAPAHVDLATAWPGGERLLDADDFEIVGREAEPAEDCVDAKEPSAVDADPELDTMEAMMHEQLEGSDSIDRHDAIQNEYFETVARLQAEREATARLRNQLEVARALAGLGGGENARRAATRLAVAWRVRRMARTALPGQAARAARRIQSAARQYLAAVRGLPKSAIIRARLAAKARAEAAEARAAEGRVTFRVLNATFRALRDKLEVLSAEKAEAEKAKAEAEDLASYLLAQLLAHEDKERAGGVPAPALPQPGRARTPPAPPPAPAAPALAPAVPAPAPAGASSEAVKALETKCESLRKAAQHWKAKAAQLSTHPPAPPPAAPPLFSPPPAPPPSAPAPAPMVVESPRRGVSPLGRSVVGMTVGEMISALGLESNLPVGGRARYAVGAAVLSELGFKSADGTPRPTKPVQARGSITPAYRAVVYSPAELPVLRRHVLEAAKRRGARSAGGRPIEEWIDALNETHPT